MLVIFKKDAFSCLLGYLQIEAATGGVLQKKLFLEISQSSQQNTCTRVSF